MRHDDGHYDRHQFEQPETPETSDKIISARGNGLSTQDAKGMQVITPLLYPHYDAEWAKDKKQVDALLRTVFPALFRESDPTPIGERRSFSLCARWYEVINLYFKNGWDQSSIADHMGMTPRAVNSLIRTIRYARKGLNRHGKPRRRTA